MNADLSDKLSMFAKHLVNFCEENNLILSSQILLPAESYTYISEAWHTTSWLDHCISTADAHAILESIEIVYEASMSDHIPVVLVLDVDSLPEMSKEVNTAGIAKLDWSKLSNNDVLSYFGRSNDLFNKVLLPYDAILCADVNCKVNSHSKDLCLFYDSIVGALYEASRPMYQQAKSKKKVKPGWNKHVAAKHAEAKRAHKAWVLAGRPRQGPVLDNKKNANNVFKSAVRYICKHEVNMRADSMADKLLGHNVNGFWKEVRALNSNNVDLPCNMEGVSGGDNIAELWREHYSQAFNCVKSDPYKFDTINCSATGITAIEVRKAIEQLKDNKASGSDKVTAEHLKHASPKVAVLLAICLTGLLTHGVLPNSMLSVTLVPIVKDKAGKVGSMDNYRPIALASVLSKVLERILLDRLSSFITTTDNQYGFKAKHGTDLCIYALKEVIEKYKSQNSTVLVGLVDASRAFDRVNHQKLFLKLKERGVPDSIIRILAYWYANQSMQVRWGNAVSAPLSVSNGVRQGGLLSPALFNLYMNDLSVQLNNCKTGCKIGNTVINHLMYADDLAVLSPSSAGFQQLLDVCTEYGVTFDVKYNAKKSVVLTCRTKEDKNLSFPAFCLAGQVLPVCSKAKYLGHVINDQLTDDDDLYRQRRTLYAQANMLKRKFHFCSVEVKVNLFRAFCTPLYTAPLWVKFKKASMNKLQVAYNDCMRILMRKPRWSSASELFVNLGISTFQALRRNLMFKFMGRVNESQNSIIRLLINPCLSVTRYQSPFWEHWYECLFYS